jgi:hypothetical protein
MFLARWFIHNDDGGDTFIRNVGSYESHAVLDSRRRNSSGSIKVCWSFSLTWSLAGYRAGKLVLCAEHTMGRGSLVSESAGLGSISGRSCDYEEYSSLSDKVCGAGRGTYRPHRQDSSANEVKNKPEAWKCWTQLG